MALVEVHDTAVEGPLKTINDSLPQDSVDNCQEHKKAVAYIQWQQRLAKAILGRTF
jgi:hypothetical protein